MIDRAVIDWLLPLTAIIVMLLMVSCVLKAKSKSMTLSFLRKIEDCVIENYILFLVASMALLPLLLQFVYAVPICTSSIKAGDVLAFWGVVLGIVGAAFSYQRQKMFEADRRLRHLSPNLEIELAHHENDEPYRLVLHNRSPFTYLLVSACGVEQGLTVSGLSRVDLSISKDDFAKFNEEHRSSLQTRGVDVSLIPRVVSLELYDPDGNKWHIVYKYVFPHGGWEESSRSYIAFSKP